MLLKMVGKYEKYCLKCHSYPDMLKFVLIILKLKKCVSKQLKLFNTILLHY